MSHVIAAFIGLASGLAIAGAVFALIAAIGVVPHMAAGTGTARHVRVYEEAIIFGGIFGAATMVFDMRISLWSIMIVVVGLCAGVFFGVFVMSLAEELNVLPIMSKRLSIRRGVGWLILAVALGKAAGSLLYFIVTGFFSQAG